MPIFDAKPRSWGAYVARIGASGVLMASALVMFVILVGVVTLKTWPNARGLLDGGGGATLQSAATPAPQVRAHPSTLNLVKRFGGGPAASHQEAHPGATGVNPAENGGLTGGSTGQPGTGVEQPPAQSQPSNAVSQALSGVGNTVQSSTERLGDSLGGSSSPGLGGVLGGVGRSLNSDLQSLAGTH